MIKHGLAAVALSAASQLASAQTYAFDCITNTSATNCNAGEAQLRVAVSGPSAQQALFSFTNVGSAALSLTDVYFGDGTLLGIASISSGPGVVFSRGGRGF